MRSGNPTLTADTFTLEGRVARDDAMTIQGTVNKTAFTLLVLTAAAAFVWSRAFAGLPVGGYMGLGALGGFVVALVTVFKKTAAPYTTPLYGALEGLFLGGISAGLEARYPGIVLNAVFLTLATLFGLLAAYKSRMIPVTQNLRLGIAAATGGIMLLYLAQMVMGFFGVRMPFLHESGPIGIAFSLFVVGIAAFNLVLDFDFIEQGADRGAPAYMEWYGAFGLTVTLVWLYLEILRLLVKLQDRRR
ncbi:MAG: Bax inhibitor-1/YccA family protein [Elusimicrobia bacterium]|nr:Bax inhibitor-1/YccA family protein [Elusimicrobiota bacterium]